MLITKSTPETKYEPKGGEKQPKKPPTLRQMGKAPVITNIIDLEIEMKLTQKALVDDEGQKGIMSIQSTMDQLPLFSTQTQEKGDQGEVGSNGAKDIKDDVMSSEDGGDSSNTYSDDDISHHLNHMHQRMRKIHKIAKLKDK